MFMEDTRIVYSDFTLIVNVKLQEFVGSEWKFDTSPKCLSASEINNFF